MVGADLSEGRRGRVPTTAAQRLGVGSSLCLPLCQAGAAPPSPPTSVSSQGGAGSKAVMLKHVCALSQPGETVVALVGGGEAWLESRLALSPLCHVVFVPGSPGQRAEVRGVSPGADKF